MKYIEKIKGNKWDKFIADNVDFLEDMLTYGENIIGSISEHKKSRKSVENFYESVIILLLVECLQCLDGIVSLFKEQSIDISIDLIRSLLELSMYLVYILEDDSLIEKKAIAYEINNINNKIKNYDMLFNNSNDNKYVDEKNNLLQIFRKYNIYNEVKTEWDDKENNLNNKKGYKKKKVKIKWYSLHGGGNNFRELCKHTKLDSVYGVYGLFSSKIHGSNAMDGIYVNKNKKTFIKNPKIPFYAPEILECIYQLVSALYVGIIKCFFNVNDMINFTQWNKEITIRKDILIKNWNGFRDEYIKGGNLY